MAEKLCDLQKKGSSGGGSVDLLSATCKAAVKKSGGYSSLGQLTITLPKTANVQYMVYAGRDVGTETFSTMPNIGDAVPANNQTVCQGVIVLDSAGNFFDYSPYGFTISGSSITTQNNYRGGNWVSLFEL